MLAAPASRVGKKRTRPGRRAPWAATPVEIQLNGTPGHPGPQHAAGVPGCPLSGHGAAGARQGAPWRARAETSALAAVCPVRDADAAAARAEGAAASRQATSKPATSDRIAPRCRKLVCLLVPTFMWPLHVLAANANSKTTPRIGRTGSRRIDPGQTSAPNPVARRATPVAVSVPGMPRPPLPNGNAQWNSRGKLPRRPAFTAPRTCRTCPVRHVAASGRRTSRSPPHARRTLPPGRRNGPVGPPRRCAMAAKA